MDRVTKNQKINLFPERYISEKVAKVIDAEKNDIKQKMKNEQKEDKKKMEIHKKEKE